MFKSLVAANWKENTPPNGWDVEPCAYQSTGGVDVCVFPMDQDIPVCVDRGLVVGAQWGNRDGHTMQYYKELGCTYVLCGHSDRRNKEGETDQDIAVQVQEAIDAGLIPILCVGETAEERKKGMQQDVIRNQMNAYVEMSHRDVSAGHTHNSRRFIIAYEPVWAIGTGNVATPDDVEAMHAFIRSILPDTAMLYGGSVKAENAESLIAVPNVDGFLVGGASLTPEEFAKIIAVAAR